MTDRFRLTIAQLNPTVGDLAGNAAQARDAWAEIAATYSHRAGRLWRNLQDTTNEAAMAKSRSGNDWSSWQRGADYYARSAR